MRPATPFMPTRREILLLTLLLISLLFITQTDYIATSKTCHNCGISLDEEEDILLDVNATRKPIMGIYPDPVLSWNETVPESELITHVPGTLPAARLDLATE